MTDTLLVPGILAGIFGFVIALLIVVGIEWWLDGRDN